MGRFLFASAFLVAACQQQAGGDANAGGASNVNAAVNAVAAQARPAPAATGCADRLVFVMNPEPSQLALQQHMAAERLESVRRATEERFKAVARAMCAGGELPSTTFDAFDRVMITDAEGATEPTIHAGENRTLNYELAFAGDQNVPSEEAFRSALLCLQDANREGCFED